MKRGFPVLLAWNFTEFLINGDGEVVVRLEPNIDPMEDAIVEAVEALLPAGS